MIKKIYLCGHTGSVNRGCEAILRSTAFILNQCKVSDVTALTFDKQYDEMLRVGEVLDLQSYPKRSALLRAVSKVRRKWFHDGVWGSRYYYYGLFENIKKNSIVFNVGGDTYCYGDPHISYALNELAQENDVPNVFWGCSVDEKVLTNKRMQEDINRYSYIVVRESLSKNILEKIVKEPKKILYACDPAFQLPIKETTLPENFLEGNTVGINLSPLVFRDYKDENDMMHQNVNVLIDYILQNTDMNVCLIPHVYNVEQHTQDIDVAGRIYERFRQTGRVSLVDTELSCVELKYIISKCRFFVGARTHATIAAYSTGVPAIALSYSIKSRGIAKDLFGTEEKYAMPWNDIREPGELKDAFITVLMGQEEMLRKRYEKILPEYKQTITDALCEILKNA